MKIKQQPLEIMQSKPYKKMSRCLFVKEIKYIVAQNCPALFHIKMAQLFISKLSSRGLYWDWLSRTDSSIVVSQFSISSKAVWHL